MFCTTTRGRLPGSPGFWVRLRVRDSARKVLVAHFQSHSDEGEAAIVVSSYVLAFDNINQFRLATPLSDFTSQVH